MNRKQYLAVSWCFMVFGILLIYYDLGLGSLGTELAYTISSSVSNFGIHIAVFDALIDMSIIVSYFLFVVFQILGWLEKSKK